MRRRLSCIAAILAACSGTGTNRDRPPLEQPADAGGDVASLPAGSCYSTSDCAIGKFCDWRGAGACGADQRTGSCVSLGPAFCSDLGFWVCGCDGNTYTNECHSAGSGVAVAYGGPCRAPGTRVACQTSDDCPFDAEFPQYCVDDPTDDCDPATTACPGVCAHGTYVCSATLPCLSQTQIGLQESPGTEACVAVTPGSITDPSLPGRCIYTTRQKCTSPADCGTGELCVPELGCDPATTTSCPSDCVRP
jgi:hypothetical protein